MAAKARIEFLERKRYRQRRLRDAARMLPIFATVLMFLPLMWPREATGQSQTSDAVIYIFVLWTALIIISFLLSRLLELSGDDDPTS